jgi:hypothetical protein
MARVMKVISALLPDPAAGSATELRTGWESMSRWSPSLLTRLADNAIEQNNEYQAA